MQDFLCLSDDKTQSSPSSSPVIQKSIVPATDKIKIAVQLPDESQKSYSLPETSHTPELLDVSINNMQYTCKFMSWVWFLDCTEWSTSWSQMAQIFWTFYVFRRQF